MTAYLIYGEAHEGAFSVDEELLATVEADSEQEALKKASGIDPRIKWSQQLGCFVFGNRRKLLVREKT